MKLLFYILASPILLPGMIVMHFRSMRWRNNPNVGALVCYRNISGGMTRCYVTELREDMAFVENTDPNFQVSQWLDFSSLYLIKR